MDSNHWKTMLLLTSLAGIASGQVVVNGDFEDVNISPAFFSFDSIQMPGWTRGGSLGDGIMAHVGFVDSQGRNTIAGHGSQFAMLGGGFDRAATATLTTMVTALTPGATYALSFLISNEGEGSSQSITVSFPSGSSTVSRTFTTMAPFSGLYWTTWEPQAMQFVATAATATLQFSAVNQQNDIGLDFVQIKPMSTTPLLQVSPASLAFTAVTGGDAPPPQTISVLSASSTAVARYAVVLDNGTANTAAPSWLTVTPIAGNTPGRLTVSANQSSLSAGSYSARIRVTLPADLTQSPLDIAVSLTVNTAAPKLDATPDYLSFAARSQSPGMLDQVLVVRNAGGGGAPTFSTAIVSSSPWLSVTTANGQTVPNTATLVHVQVNTQGLAVGGYRGLLRLTASTNTLDIPVELFVADHGPILALSVSGVRFQSRQNNGTSTAQTVSVLNLGDAGTTVNWTASVSGPSSGASPIANLGVTGGAASLSTPGSLPLTLASSATTLPVGGYYALVKVSDPGSLNSPQYVVVVLDQADAASPPKPDPAPQGLVFTGTAPAPQSISVNVDSAAGAPFQASASTNGGGSWLSVSPTTGTTSTGAPAQLVVAVNLTGLAPGVYIGGIDIAAANSLRTVNVTLIVRAAGSASAEGQFAIPAATACAPTRLVLTYTGLVNNFSVPAGWPVTLVMRLNDDCGAPVTDASVSASFSNGDPPLSLRGDRQTGQYAATWQPGFPTAQTTIVARASQGSLPPTTAQLTGGVATNNFPPPVLAPHGTLNNLNPVVGAAPLAPGTIAQVYGSGLASQTASPGVLPLANVFNGTSIIAGGLPAPLYYLSSGQLNVQVPNELKPSQQYAILASVNNAYTLPDVLDINPATPGVAAFPDGTVIAQHGDFSPVDAAHPAKAGEVLTIYLAGMGGTNPAVGSGQPSPAMEPLGRVNTAPTVFVDGQNSPVQFAGLTPSAVGLYQINFTVPLNSRTGNLDLVVMQGQVSSNTTKLPVK